MFYSAKQLIMHHEYNYLRNKQKNVTGIDLIKSHKMVSSAYNG